MAVNNKRPNRNYTSRSSVDGNLARKLNQSSVRELERQLDRSGRMDFDELYERRPETAAERNARRRAQMKAALRTTTRLTPMARLVYACAVSLAIGLTLALLLCYVRLNTISRSIVSMKSEISLLEVEQVSLLTQYEQTFDPAAVKEAAEAAGMTQPSDSQVYYISLPGEDQATVHAAGKKGGPLDRFFAAIGWGTYTPAE